jgi:hypothetical protein
MQVRDAVFLELQNTDIIDTFAKLSGERNTHLAPAVAEMTIRAHARWDAFFVQRQRGHLVQFEYEPRNGTSLSWG